MIQTVLALFLLCVIAYIVYTEVFRIKNIRQTCIVKSSNTTKEIKDRLHTFQKRVNTRLDKNVIIDDDIQFIIHGTIQKNTPNDISEFQCLDDDDEYVYSDAYRVRSAFLKSFEKTKNCDESVNFICDTMESCDKSMGSDHMNWDSNDNPKYGAVNEENTNENYNALCLRDQRAVQCKTY